MAQVKCEIEKALGVISSTEKGNKELNLVSWNGRKEVFDLRAWQDGHNKPLKGVTFTKNELVTLRDILNTLELD